MATKRINIMQIEEAEQAKAQKDAQLKVNNAVKQLNFTLAKGTRKEAYDELKGVLRAQGQNDEQIKGHARMLDATAHLAKTQGKKQTESGSRELLARASELAMGMAGGENAAMYEKRLRKVLKAVGIKDKQQDQYVAKALKLGATKPSLDHLVNVSDYIMRLASNDLALEKLKEREVAAIKKISANSKDTSAARAEIITIENNRPSLLEAEKELKKVERGLSMREAAKKTVVRSGMAEFAHTMVMSSFQLPSSFKPDPGIISKLSAAMPKKTIKAGPGPEAAAEIARQVATLQKAGLKEGLLGSIAMSTPKRESIKRESIISTRGSRA